MSETLHLDPWAGEWVQRGELIRRLYQRANMATTFRYRVRRLWRGIRTGDWEPTADKLAARAEFLAFDSAAPPDYDSRSESLSQSSLDSPKHSEPS